MQVALHVVHFDVVVPRRATSVVQGVGARMLSVPQLHKVHSKQEFDEVVEVYKRRNCYTMTP